MRVNEVKVTKEVLVRTEYVAVDGTTFMNEEECKKYEQSAMCIVKAKLKKLAYTSIYGLLEEGSDEDEVEIYNVETQEDLDNLKQYLYLKLSEHTQQKYVDNCVNEQFGKLTFGHEVICNFNYDCDYVWFVGNGSIDAYVDSIRQRIIKIITPKEETKDVCAN